jgi:hypothetical protein
VPKGILGQGIARDLAVRLRRLYLPRSRRAKRVVEGELELSELLAAAHSLPERSAASLAPPPVTVRATALALPFADRACHLVLSRRGFCHQIREHRAASAPQYVQ